MTHTGVLYMTDKKFQFQIKFDHSFTTVYYYLNWSLFSHSSLYEHRTEFYFVWHFEKVQTIHGWSHCLDLLELFSNPDCFQSSTVPQKYYNISFSIQIPLSWCCFSLGIVNSSIVGAKPTFELLKNTFLSIFITMIMQVNIPLHSFLNITVED